jgi:hypothetical protein
MIASVGVSASVVAAEEAPAPKKRVVRSRGRTLPGVARANLGRGHPDYGMTVAEHLAAKRDRIARWAALAPVSS